MQSTTRPDWFQTVPLTQPVDPRFDVVDYFGELILDEIGVADAVKVLTLSKLARVSAKTKKGKSFSSLKKLEKYKQLIADLGSHIYYDYDAEAVELNHKVDTVDETDVGCFWLLLGTYKSFQILEHFEDGYILISSDNEVAWETRDGWRRFCDIPSYDRESVGLADAQEFIDSLVLAAIPPRQLELAL